MAFLDMLTNDALAIVTEQAETTNASYYSAVTNTSSNILGIWTPAPTTPDPQGARTQNRLGTFQTTAALAPNPDIRDTVTVGGIVYRIRAGGIRNTQWIVDFDLIYEEAI